MTNKMRDTICSIIFLIFGAGMFYMSNGVRKMIETDVGSGFVPKFIAVCIMIVAGAKLILTQLDKSASANKKENSDWDWIGGLGTVALMAFYVFTFEKLGFLISSVIYTFCQITLMSNKDNRKLPLFAVIAIALPLGVYLMFNYVIKMPLPGGILGF